MLACNVRLLSRPRNLRYASLQSFVPDQLPILFQAARSGAAPNIRWSSQSLDERRSPEPTWRFTTAKADTVAAEEEAKRQNFLKGFMPGHRKRCDSAAWFNALEPLLPSHLRSQSFSGKASSLTAKETAMALAHIITKARTENYGAIDVLMELGIKRGRWSAVMFVVESLIADAATQIPTQGPDQLPSNLNWPSLDDDLLKQSMEVGRTTYKLNGTSDQWDEFRFDPRYTDSMSITKNQAILQLWMSLGSIILESADLLPERSAKVMGYVYQVIAKLHNSNFIPDQVYSYRHTSYDSTVRRPPIMHLLSSRILTTLSDAVWRAHQDEVIEKAVRAGTTYRDLGHDPPGGRFRLKVRELGPEVWLEFVLWCCVDGGFATAGAWIVERMRTRHADNPWFAVQWTSPDGDNASYEGHIDWSRVKLRHGGTVGQIEGYSREKPFAEMESRTVSTEVILALVEGAINARSPDVRRRGETQGAAQTAVVRLLSFLEPHNLPLRYFDYLAARLLQETLFDFEGDYTGLQRLAERLKFLRSLETTQTPLEPLPSLQVDSILEQSEVYAGVLHQVLESTAVQNRFRPAAEAFALTQEVVDQSKLRSIASFLHSPRRADQGFFSTRDFTFSDEYTSSHGQLPAQKLAPFLDIVTDAGELEVGQWLLQSMDVDGPLIPLSAYNRTSLSPAILRFAALARDHLLIGDVVDMVSQRPSNPPVTFLRSLADTELKLHDFETAGRTLAELNTAKVGGIGLSNIANIVAAIIRIERTTRKSPEERIRRLLNPAQSLLEWVLRGDFRSITGDFTKEQIKEYRRSIACLLRVAEVIPNSVLPEIARRWMPEFAESNVVGLNPRVFDIVLDAVVQSMGAKVGMMLWDLFCEERSTDAKETEGWVHTRDIKLVSAPGELELRPSGISNGPGFRIWSRNQLIPIRLAQPSTSAAFDWNSDLGGADGTSDEVVYDDGDNDDARQEKKDFGRESSEMDRNKDEEDGNAVAASGVFEKFRTASRLDEPSAETEVRAEKEPSHTRPPPQSDIPLEISGDFDDMVAKAPLSSEAAFGLPAQLNEWDTEDQSSPDIGGDDEYLSVPSDSPTNPIVTPTFRSLRIIVRALVDQLETAQRTSYTEDPEIPALNVTSHPSQANMRAYQLAKADVKLMQGWIKPRLRRFGMIKEDLATEFGKGFHKDEYMFSTLNLSEKIESAKAEYEKAKSGMLASMSEVNIAKRYLGPPIRKTEQKVPLHKYTERELAFYENLRNMVDKSPKRKDK
jgi:hypothetical protein